MEYGTPDLAGHIEAWLSGELSEDDRRLLEETFRSDPESLAFFIEQLAIHESLAALLGAEDERQRLILSVCRVLGVEETKHLSNRIMTTIRQDADDAPAEPGDAARPADDPGAIESPPQSERRVVPFAARTSRRPRPRVVGEWFALAAGLAVAFGWIALSQYLFRDWGAPPRSASIATAGEPLRQIESAPRSGPVIATMRHAGDVAGAPIPVRNGEGIATPAGSYPVVEFMSAEETKIILWPGTRAAFWSSDAGKRIDLASGLLDCYVGPQPEGKPMRLNGAAARLEVLGTHFAYSSDGTASSLHVIGGRVRMTHASGTGRIVSSGESGHADASGLRVEKTRPRIERFDLIDIPSKSALPEWGALRNGAAIPRSAFSGRELTLVAVTDPPVVGSVRLTLTGPLDDPASRTENRLEQFAPYTLLGDSPPPTSKLGPHKIGPWEPVPGEYLVRATPFCFGKGRGQAGNPAEIRILILPQ